MRDGHVRIGDAVAVFGMGAIGLLVIQFAKLAGAYPVIAVDPLANRRQAALQCGADMVLDPTACDAGLEIKEMTGKRGADVCIDYSGSPHALQAALRGLAYLGTVVAGAAPGVWSGGLDLGVEAHMNRPHIIFSRACSEPNPAPMSHPLLQLENVIATPHCAGMTHESMQQMGIKAAEQWQDIFAGKVPPRLVNPQAWVTYRVRFNEQLGFWPSELAPAVRE